MENNGFKWNKINNEIININNNYEFINIINDINRYEFNVINSNIYNNIELISNEITIDLYPFNNFNLNDKLKPLIKYENYYSSDNANNSCCFKAPMPTKIGNNNRC